nr:hypothetical protein [Tanacetum cinerariifolium]
MPPKRRSQTNPQPLLTQQAINQLVREGIEAAIKVERERVREKATKAGGPAGGPVAQECTFTGFMKCGPTQFHSTEGVVGLYRWFERIESTFRISECAERRKVKFSTATLHGRALTWLEDELRHLKLRDTNIATYTERFNELALLCPDVVANEKKKVELYIKGLPEIADQRGGNATGQAYVIRDAKQGQGPNVVTVRLNISYEVELADGKLVSTNTVLRDKSFVNSGLSHLIDIKSVRLNISYEVELADGKLVSTNTVLRCYTLNLLNQLFEVNLMPIELSTFDVIIGMDWLVKHDALIVCEKKEVHIPVKAHVMEKEPKEKCLEDVLIIHDFPEVFHDDSPGLPPPQQVEFRIELMHGAAHIAHTPYRLAPSEMKELSDQLKELSEKGFIRPSS